ncbi:hypothetical protein [Herbaspirillum huttiense]|uniref:hypothetical protein n=1 Tax=Herbaspirillum huttiense TaxID=863372 RepID=UPI0031D29797
MNLMQRLEGPSVVPMSVVMSVKSFREACREAWARRPKNMTAAMLCQLTGMRPSHASEYFAVGETDAKGRELRDMPAKYLPAFEEAIGNSFASQWLAMQSQLTILEAQIAEQKAAQWAK